MPELIHLPSFSEKRGSLTVIENVLPFEIKRVFYIYAVDNSIRGNHRHHKTIQAAVSISGSCVIHNNNGQEKQEFLLNSPDKCLLLYPDDFHSMSQFTENAILMVLASEFFDPEDYIYEPYK